jgi:hypothetical protein
MDDTLRHDREPTAPTEAEMLAALARSDADLAAGRIVPAAVVHAELDAALARVEAGRPGQHKAATRL